MVISSPAAVLWVLWRGVLQLPPLALGNRLHDANAKRATRSGRVGRNPCPPKRGKVRTEKWGVTREQLVEAVQKAGVSAEAVARQLGKAQ